MSRTLKQPLQERPPPWVRQTGAAALLTLLLLALLASGVLLGRLNSAASIPNARNARTTASLVDARAALIAWSTTYQAGTQRETGPGVLPYPDRSGIDGNYDGMADCDALDAGDVVLLGRLPWAGEDSASCDVTTPLYVDLQDAAGEPLWYAVSRNLLANGAGGPINPGMGEAGRATYPWIALRDAQGDLLTDAAGAPLAVAAVIFAPGAAVADQDRSGAAVPADYLDSTIIDGRNYDNADADGCPDDQTPPCLVDGVPAGEEFVVNSNPQPGEAFNDELTYITVDQLMRSVEKRVLGEAELFLDDYRASNGVYPWLADFRYPRGVRGDASNASSSTFMDDADAVPPANFIAAGVRVGDTIVNLTTGGRAYITEVAATSIAFNALEGGSDADFEAGDDYLIEASLSSDMARNGLIPLGQRPNEVFKTGFTIQWNFVDIHNIDADSGGSASSLVPATAVENTLVTVVIGPDDGYCRWTVESRVACYGKTVAAFVRSDLAGTPTVQRTIEVNIGFDASGTDDSDPAPFFDLPAVVVNSPTATSPRTRDLSISSTALGANIPFPPGGLAPELTVAEGGIVRTTDTLTSTWGSLSAGEWGSQELKFAGAGGDNHGDGRIRVSGIRYEPSINFDNADGGDDQIPEWFVDNDWHHYIYAAFAEDVVAGGDGDCTTPGSPTPPTCLTLNVAGDSVPSEIQGLVISAGVALPTQDRAIGDCDGDGTGQIDNPADDSFLCAYFDSENTDAYDVSAEKLRHGANALSISPPDDSYARDNHSNRFNDQVRVIDLAP